MIGDIAAIAAGSGEPEQSGCPDCGLLCCVCFGDDEREDEDDGFDDCHMGPDGYCGLAGTEYCDWECKLYNSHFGRTPA